ncbi:MAG: phospholipase D-like domain-containing protein [Bacillota bacterium]
MSRFFSYNLSNVEFVAGEDTLCFQKVLDDFANAEYIYVLTYNVSERNSVLLEAIKNAARKDIPVNIITNIPNRWNSYWGAKATEKARNTIQIYERKLDPHKIGRQANVFFKFNNHAKIIMTNNIIYWGSANFSEESQNNYECGTISTDKNFINFLKDVVFTDIISSSTSYYQSQYNTCLLALFSAVSTIHSIQDEISEASYEYRCDYDTNFKDILIFNKYDNYLTEEMLDTYIKMVVEFDELLQNLENDLNESDYDKGDLSGMINSYDHFVIRQNSKIIDICQNVQPLVSFNEQNYVLDILQDDFYSEAYDENLEYYAQKAFEMGREKKEELIAQCKNDIISLQEILSNYEQSLLQFIDQVMAIAKENEEIDNT